MAAPYDTPSGERVLSGAFEPANTPLGAYFSSVVPVSGGNAFLIDDRGELLTQGDGTTGFDPAFRTTDAPVTHVEVGGETITVSTEWVEGAPWRVVLVAPSAALYAPVDGGRWFAWVLWGALAAVGVAVLQLALRLNRARGSAARKARTDDLTGLPNRRAMEELLGVIAAEAERRASAAVLLVDVDHFKQVNDHHGHPAGDEALRIVAAVLRRSLRDGDIAGRWGGEEFLVVLRPTDTSRPEDVAERIRAAVSAQPMPFGPDEQRCTVSVGVAAAVDGDVDDALRAADVALYRAKEGGRDRVEVATGAR